MVAPWRNAPVPEKLSSPQAAVDTALAASPGMKVESVAMPGTPFAGGHHYAVFLIGDQPLTSRLIKPVLIDAADGVLSVQVAFALQLFSLESEHSLMLLQTVPVPLKPVLQAQVKLPGVLLHSAFALQLLVPPAHSSTSEQVVPVPV